MTLMVTLEQIKQGNTCEPAVQELINYFQTNNITQISFEDVIAHWKALGKRDWAIWAYKNKSVFEQLVNYVPTTDEQTQDMTDLNALEVLNLIGYSVNGITYSTLTEAQTARQNQLEIIKTQIKPLIVCNLEVFNANGDATWTIVDVDTVSISDNSNIQVFNPITGQYTAYATLHEAVAARDALLVPVSDQLNGSARVLNVMQNPEFPNEQYLQHDI